MPAEGMRSAAHWLNTMPKEQSSEIMDGEEEEELATTDNPSSDIAADGAVDKEGDEESHVSDSDDDDDDDDVGERSKVSKRKEDEDLSCPHCHKVFTTALGREYHISHFVCRKELKNASSTAANKKLAAPSLGSGGNRRRKRSDSSSSEDDDDDSGSDEEDDGSGESEGDDSKSAKPKAVVRTSFGRQVRRRVAKLSYTFSPSSDEEEDESVGSGGAGERAVTTAGGKKRPRSKGGENANDPTKRGDDDTGGVKAPLESDALSPNERQCPHCSQAFSTFPGLKYHVDKFVCRPELRPNGPVVKGRRRKADSAAGGSTYKRIRGSLSDRTCPKCRRVFTSALGMQYHTEKRVCEVVAAHALAKSHPFHRLAPGHEFVTIFGVVRVLNDDRGPDPVGRLPEKGDKVVKQWKTARSKRMMKVEALHAAATGANLFRRRALGTLYTKGLVSAGTVSDVYSRTRTDAGGKESSERFVVPEESPDPEVPAESYPDRIVECAFIPDAREHITLDRDGSEDSLVCSSEGIPGSRMYVRRRDLTEGYVRDEVTFTCCYCGQTFASRPGATYHLRSSGCDEGRVKGAKDDYQKRLKDIQRRADFLERVSSNPDALAPVAATAPKPKKRATKVNDLAVYPQVWLSLGLKLMPRSETTTKEGMVSAFPAKRPSTKQLGVREPVVVSSSTITTGPTARKETKLVADPSKDPRVVLENLRRQLLYEESRAIGPMYHEVYKALQYEQFDPVKAEARRKRERREAKKAERQRRKRAQQQVRRSKQEVTAAPKIDVQVILGDLQAGRFPSFLRYTGEHDTMCCLCRQDGDVLHGCDYCHQAVHYSCMCRKWIVRKPEPCVGFLCHTCIGHIVTRRTRAEKRLIDKAGYVTRDQASVVSKLPLLKGVVEGREYECLEAQGQRVSDVTVLLSDADSRLTATLGTSTLNTLRLSMIDPSREITRDL
jgi:hypothetical protein